MKRLRMVAALGLLGASGCESGESPRSRAGGQPPAEVRAPASAEARGAAPAAAAPAAPRGSDVEWKGTVQWHTWSDGLARAGRESKPIFLLVYADWCPHCRALGPVFADPEIEALARRFVMVRQNHDDAPAWLEPYTQKFGGYVPRIFFFDPSGKLREDVTSGHPRYPYFYAAQEPAFLKKSMRQAAGS